MKAKFFALMAVVLAVVSCQKDVDSLDVNMGGNVATISVTLPENAITRAADRNSAESGLVNTDGELVRIIFEVYYKGETNADLRQYAYLNEGELTANFDVRLVPNRDYTFVAWADQVDATTKENKYFDVKDLKNVQILDWKAMDECRDAYTATKLVEDFNSGMGITLTLTRPFAKLRVKTTDMAQLNDLGIMPTKATVTYTTKHYNSFNAFEGKVIADSKNRDIKHELFTIESYDEAVAEDADMTLFTDYFFATSEEEVVNFAFDVYDQNNELIKSNTFNTPIPVKRNNLTTIAGNILTEGNNIDVVVKPEFGDEGYEWPSESAEKLAAAAMFGGEVTLTEDVVLTNPLVVKAKMTLNLGGKTISGSFHKSLGAIIKNESVLTIVGGTISSTGNNGGSAIQNNGTLTVKDATLNGAPNADGSWPSYTVNNTGSMVIENTTITSYHGAVASYGDGAVVTLNNSIIDMSGIPGFTSHGIYTYNDGKVIVNGGTYENKATDQASSGASVINGAVEVNAGTFSGRIENYYGTPVLKGGTFSVNPNKNFIVAGYKALMSNNMYTIVPEDADMAVSTWNELKAAINTENAVVYIIPREDGEKILLEGKISLKNGVKLIGMGETPVEIFNDWGSNTFANQAHFTNTCVENIYFSNNLAIDAGIVTGDVKFKNCIFGGDLAHQGVHFDSGNGTITFEDCTFVGRNMLGSSIEKVTFNNCTFLNKKSSLTGADKWTGVNMWGKYEFNNCIFDTEAHCNVKCDGVVAAFNGCYFNDNRDITTIINNGSNYNATITFDGNKYVANGLIEDENGNYVVNSLTTLETALETAGAAGAGDTTIVFAENAQLDMTNVEWNPIEVDGYNGADIVTIEGNGAVITGLKSALFAGGFAGGSGIVIKNLTIENSEIVADNTQGYGAFVNCADSMEVITLINCHLKNSSIITPNNGANESRIGGLVGWTAGYNKQNDGPVDSYITIENCSVTGCTLKGAGSIGGICGHAGANAATFTTITNCTVTGNTFISTDSGSWRVGVVVGTANNGQCEINSITESGNTLEQTGNTAPTGEKRNYYGRFVPSGTGHLTIDGVEIN